MTKRMLSNHFVFLVLRCATARAVRSTQSRWAIWSRRTWTNTNMLGNIGKERTQGRHRKSATAREES